jgi:hypothetical protein
MTPQAIDDLVMVGIGRDVDATRPRNELQIGDREPTVRIALLGRHGFLGSSYTAQSPDRGCSR